MRRALLTAQGKVPVVLPAIGDAFMGGYYAGIIDTTRPGSIIAADASQSGLRYALIISPKSSEGSPRAWKSGASSGPGATSTLWNGLAATQAMAAAAETYPAAEFCNGLTYPSDGASSWYLPARDELEVLYRSFKPDTSANFTGFRDGQTFPGGSGSQGQNAASDPTGAAYTSSVPARTSVIVFRDGGAQQLGIAGSDEWYWSSTEADATLAHAQAVSGSSTPGNQAAASKTSASTNRVRPVRRLLL